MKVVVLFTAVLVFSSLAYTQSGRRAKAISSPIPAPTEEAKPATKPGPPEPPPVTAEKNQDYRCTDDGSLARILETNDATERVVSAKEADERPQITKKPQPDYTRVARRNGVQGFVTLKVLLSAGAKVSRIRVLKGLPAGLTENAIRAACRIQFKPAVKGGQPASMWVTVEYAFRLADSSIFRP
ncbi:MAG: energy transducer TonB [bacterium]